MNRWKELDTAGAGWGWYYKLGHYFFGYSLLGRLGLSAQLQALALFHAGMSLLLCWQFYRLARTCGLDDVTAMLFVLVQAFVFGNDIFGFYRYYSLSSTVPALIGALAATRAFLIFVSAKSLAAPRAWRQKAAPLAAVCAATLFAAHQHVQGLAIAGLGMAAVAGWTICRRWSRRARIWAVGLLVAANVAMCLFWPKHPYLDSVFRRDGWLNGWYGFELLRPGASGTRRAILILGVGGILNLIAGLALLKRNHVVGWLTLFPVLALMMPLTSIPLANALAAVSPQAIVVFHRALLGIPAGLALVVLVRQLSRRHCGPRVGPWLAPAAAAAAALMFVMPPDYPWFNRTWHALVVPAQDATLHQVMEGFYGNPPVPAPGTLVLAGGGVSVALQSYAPITTLFTSQERLLHSSPDRSPAADGERVARALASIASGSSHQVLPVSPQQLTTPGSQAAFLSKHWRPDEVALAFTRP